jgi:hypothetical protein
MSCGRLLGAMDNDAALSAQSKCAEGGEMGPCWGFWGKLGVWDVFQGCFTGSGCVCHHSGAAGGGPGLGRAGDLVVIIEYIDSDMAVAADVVVIL